MGEEYGSDRPQREREPASSAGYARGEARGRPLIVALQASNTFGVA